MRYQSSYIRLETVTDDGLAFLGVYSLGKGRLESNLLREAAPAPGWEISVSYRRIALRSGFQSGRPAKSQVLTCNPRVCHATLRGRMKDDGSVRLPAPLRLPDYGTFHMTAKGTSRPLLNHAWRDSANRQKSVVKVGLLPPNAFRPSVAYELEVVAVYP